MFLPMSVILFTGGVGGFPAFITGHMTRRGSASGGVGQTPFPRHWESGRYASYWNASWFGIKIG